MTQRSEKHFLVLVDILPASLAVATATEGLC